MEAIVQLPNNLTANERQLYSAQPKHPVYVTGTTPPYCLAKVDQPVTPFSPYPQPAPALMARRGSGSGVSEETSPE